MGFYQGVDGRLDRERSTGGLTEDSIGGLDRGVPPKGPDTFQRVLQ